MVTSSMESWESGNATTVELRARREVASLGSETKGNDGSIGGQTEAGRNSAVPASLVVPAQCLAANDQPFAAVVFVDTGNAATDILISYNTLTSPPAPNGGDYKIQWASAGVFNLT